MSISGIQGRSLEVNVIGCTKLKNTEWISRQDPYVCLEYANSKFRTRTCTDGGKNPIFQEKFVLTLIEGLRDINIVVWNSNTLTNDDYIGSGKVQLQKVLSQGYDDNSWPLQTKTGRYAGEVRLIMHYDVNKQSNIHIPSAPPHVVQPPPQTSFYSSSSVAQSGAYYPSPSPYPSCPPGAAGYPPPAYPLSHAAAYPPQPHRPPLSYPPPPYPPAPNAQSYYPPGPPGPYPGVYPPPY